MGKEKKKASSMNTMFQDMEMEMVKKNISAKHKSMVREIDQKLEKIFDDFLNEVTKLSLNNFEVEKLFLDGLNGKVKPKPVEHPKQNGKIPTELQPRTKLPDKLFQPRNSLLTDLFEIKHIKTIYHIFIVIFNLLLLNVFISDFADTGNINIGLGPILTGFGGITYGLLLWAMMQAIIFAVYPVFKIWSVITRRFFLEKGLLTSLWHMLGVIFVISSMISFGYFFSVAVGARADLAMASSVAVMMELVRFIMKAYAFIRTNVPRVLNSKNKLKVDDITRDATHADNNSGAPVNGSSSVNDKRVVPTFSQYAYFLFAPTLVYRDEYPRTKRIRWNFVAMNLSEVIAVIFIYSLISERIMYPVWNQFGSESYSVEFKELMGLICSSMLPGLLCYLCGFYCVLHSWMNAAAEVLRFSDRKFYSDWWNSTNFAVYYRTWNIIVHDWLYQYVYKDLHAFGFGRIFSQLIVFCLSAVFHEFILSFTFKFFYPILFVQFQGAGVLMIFITRKGNRAIGNIAMFLSIAIGMGILLSLYHMEYYARMHCEFDRDDWYNYLVPVSWSCNGIRFSENWEIKIHL